MKINVKLLRKVQKHILAVPARVDMNMFIARRDDDDACKFPKCGTIGCIAGWAVTLSTGEKVPYGSIQPRATKLLGLNANQARILFFPGEWPAELSDRAEATEPQTLAHAQLVSERIDLFIKTKGAE